jgi:hypothetical protein
LPAIHLARDEYSEHIKNSKKLNTERTNIPTDNWANKLDNSQKKYKWLITHENNVQQPFP